MPIYVKGSARYVGMLRNSLSDGKSPDRTAVKLKQRYHVWDVLEHRYYGCVDAFEISLDMHPRFFALLPSNPIGFKLRPAKTTVRQGEALRLTGAIDFDGGDEDEIARIGQVAHVEVTGPAGRELEWYRDNVLFDGFEFEIALPISYSERPGQFTIQAEHTVTGMLARAEFQVSEGR